MTHPPPSRAAFIEERLLGLAGEWLRTAGRERARDTGCGWGEDQAAQSAAEVYQDCAAQIEAVLVAALDLAEAGPGCPAGPGHLAAARWHLTKLDVQSRARPRNGR